MASELRGISEMREGQVWTANIRASLTGRLPARRTQELQQELLTTEFPLETKGRDTEQTAPSGDS